MLPGLGQNILGKFGEVHLPQIGNNQLEQPDAPERRFLADELTLYPSLSINFPIRAAIASLLYGCLFRKTRHRGYRNTGLMGHVRHRHSVFASHGDHPTRLCWRYENDSPATMSSKGAVG